MTAGAEAQLLTLATEYPAYLRDHAQTIASDAIQALRLERGQWIARPEYAAFRAEWSDIPKFTSRRIHLDQALVTIGDSEELMEDHRAVMSRALRAFMPWKKGPFCLFDQAIDAEWRSDVKWERLRPALDSLSGKRVADIGCHNGYFMFRMAAESPELVVGLEPYAKHWLNFHLIHRFTSLSQLHFELLGVEHIHHFTRLFDVVFCLGILYHHTDPVGILRKIHESMVPGGQLVVDCQGIPGSEPVSLTPLGRYAGAKGIWFLPTATCLEHWLRRANFRNVDLVYGEPLTSLEQRATEWAPVKSLADFLDPTDPKRTVEGYPAPYRFYMVARK